MGGTHSTHSTHSTLATGASISTFDGFEIALNCRFNRDKRTGLGRRKSGGVRSEAGTASHREPGQMNRSGQVRFITRPKSRTMRATRQLMLPPNIVS